MLLDENQEQIYQANIKYDMQEADVDVKLEFGEVEIWVSFDQNFKDSFTLKDAIQKSIVVTDEQGKTKSNDIVIF